MTKSLILSLTFLFTLGANANYAPQEELSTVNSTDFGRYNDTPEHLVDRGRLCPGLKQPAVLQSSAPQAPRLNYDSRAFRDLLAYCAGIVGELELALDDAQIMAAQNDWFGANHLLFTTLSLKAADLKVYPWGAPPHVLQAIIEGQNIADLYQSRIDRDGEGWNNRSILADVRKDQAFFIFMRKVYKLVFYAYYELDQRYSMAYDEVCINGRYCYSTQSVFDLFDDRYFENMQILAEDFIHLLTEVMPTVQSDKLEFRVTSAFMSAASNILASSVYSREFECLALDMWQIARRAEQFACSSQVPMRGQQLNIIRSMVGQTLDRLSSYNRRTCSAYTSVFRRRGRPSNHRSRTGFGPRGH